MAQQIVVEMVDDLDGTVGDDVTTVVFTLDGRLYEIDLCERNASELRKSLADFVAASRRQRGDRVTRRTRSSASSADQDARQRAHAIREWAEGKGHQLSERGRIPADVVTAYAQAQQGTKDSAPEPDPSVTEVETSPDQTSPANLPSFSG